MKKIYVHPAGICESTDVGEGTRIWAFAHVLPGARIGRSCNICDGAFVEGGAVLGDRVTVKNGTLIFDRVTCGDEAFLGPNVLFTNDLRPRARGGTGPAGFLPTEVGRGASLGAGTVVVCGVTIGDFAFVAAGSVVTRDVPAHAFVAGNPARHRGWVCRCCGRLDERLVCDQCGSVYEHVPDGSGLRSVLTFSSTAASDATV